MQCITPGVHQVGMDSFEARVQYLNVLKNLNKTLDRDNEDKKFQDPIQFYLNTYVEHYEDYHFCLLDYIKKLNTLDRLPCFIYYIRLMDQLFILNNKDTVKVLENVFIPSIVELIKLIIPVGNIMSMTNLNVVEGMVTNSIKLLGLSETNPDVTNDINEYFDELRQWQEQLFNNFKENNILVNTADRGTDDNNNKGMVEILDTSTIINRMERDRERHKRLKQQNWQCERVPHHNEGNISESLDDKPSITNKQEFFNRWNTVEELNSIDLDIINECNKIAMDSYAIN